MKTYPHCPITNREAHEVCGEPYIHANTAAEMEKLLIDAQRRAARLESYFRKLEELSRRNDGRLGIMIVPCYHYGRNKEVVWCYGIAPTPEGCTEGDDCDELHTFPELNLETVMEEIINKP